MFNTTKTREVRLNWPKLMGLFLLGFLLLSLLLVCNPKINTNDAIGYYAPTVSLIEDGDIELQNQVRHYKQLAWVNNLQFDPVTEKYYSQYPLGVTILQTPVLFLLKLMTGESWNPYDLRTTGLVNRMASLLGIVALLMLWLVLRRLFGNSTAIYSIFLLSLSTALYFYTFIQSSYAHVYSFFWASLLLWLYLTPLINNRGELDLSLAANRTWKRSIVLGLVLGMLCITRYLDGLLAMILLAEFVYLVRMNRRYFLSLVSNYTLAFIAFCAVLSIQLYAQYWLHDNFRILDYYDGHFQIEGALTRWPGILFSSFHGLFYWHPSLILALIAWGMMIFYGNRNWKEWAKISVLIFLLMSGVTAAWGRFAYGASSFGHRFFISFYPFFAIGIAYTIAQLKNKAISKAQASAWVLALSFLVLWNFGLMLQMIIGLIPSDAPVSWWQMAENNFYYLPKWLWEQVYPIGLGSR